MEKTAGNQVRAFGFALSRRSFKVLSVAIVALLLSVSSGAGAAPAPSAAPASSEMTDLIAAAKKEGTVNLYSGYTAADNIAAAALFKAKFGINVDIFRADTNQLLLRYGLEWKTGIEKTDVLALADAMSSAQLQTQGMLMPYVPPAVKEPGYIGKYAGTHFQVAGLTIWPAAWNTDKVKGADVPTDFRDFVKPQWSGGKLGMLDASILPVGQQYYYILRNALGVDFMKQLGAQKFRLMSPNNAIAEQLVSSELLGAPVMIFSVVQQFKALKAPIEAGYMKTGTPVMVRTIQIASKPKNPNAAKLFVNFFLTKEGQEGLQKVAQAMSPRSDVTVEGIPVAGSFVALSIEDVADFVAKQKEIAKEFTQFFKGK